MKKIDVFRPVIFRGIYEKIDKLWLFSIEGFTKITMRIRSFQAGKLLNADSADVSARVENSDKERKRNIEENEAAVRCFLMMIDQ